ncbi:MAG: hypothetical protein HGA45_31405 [Chloroflexales bacterium]|nr:hypothetical protein [Chloroflexales bacterium]
MILVRMVFHAHHGKIGALVEGFKQATHGAPERPVLLTDLSGPMETMVLEGRHESLAAYEQWRAELFTSRRFREGQGTMDGLIASGSIEFYTIEQG